LITRAHALEAMSKCTRVIFDKTGTLTDGRLRISQVQTRPGVTTGLALGLAAALERECAHPIASAFDTIDSTEPVRDIRIVTGRGVEGHVGGRHLRIGHPDFVAELAIEGRACEWVPGPGGVVLGDDQGPMASIELQDRVRPEAERVIRGLAGMGLEVELASGDRESAVLALANQLGISQVHSNMTPESKLDLLRQRQSKGDKVMMVGDGINDAPVLAGADISLALGSGAALAQSTADSILLGNSLRPLLLALKTARGTLIIVRQNLAWALAYNAVALPLAAAGMVQPWMAAIGMSASSLLVVVNALRVSRISDDPEPSTDKVVA
jgi:Cu2+-exporting ATPase